MWSTLESTFGDLLRQLRSEAGLTQEELAERAGLSARAISDLERGVNRYPYRSTVQSLIGALRLEGDDAEALSERARRRRHFDEPMPTPRSVPRAPTPILGRERELGLLLHMVRWEGIRFVTLTGAGGVGKTRLAEEAACELEDDFTGGSLFVSLASLADGALVPTALAAALDVRVGSATAEEALLASLRDQELFVVLDNFEHVLPAGPVVSRLLGACPKLKVLVTSREPLRLRGEHEIDVSPLPVPDPGSLPRLDDLRRVPSVALFLQRVRAVRSGFDLSDDNAGDLAEICRRLDGLPLALELAASQLKHRTPEWLLDQMPRRLDILGPGPRDLPARQQTMRATIEWSYNLLDPQEQAVFRCLSVFAGSGETDGVDAVGRELGLAPEAVSSALQALADKSMLGLESPDEHRLRFRMLETVRELAGEQLEASGGGPKARAAHADFYLRLAKEAYPELTRERADWWLGRLGAELDNLRSALRWYAGPGETAQGLQLAGSLWRLWLARGLFQEGRRWLDPMLEDDSGQAAPHPARAHALIASGVLAHQQSDWQMAESRYHEAQNILRELADEEGLGDVLNALGNLAMQKNEYDRAETFLQEAVGIARRSGRPFALGRALNNLGELAGFRGDLAQAVSLLEGALDAYRQIGYFDARITTLLNLSRVFRLQGGYKRAREFAVDCHESTRATNHWLAAEALDALGDIALAQGDLDPAERHYQESLDGFEAVQNPGEVALVLVHLANLYCVRGDYERARSSVARSLSTQERTGVNERTAAFAYLYLGDVEREQERPEPASASYRTSLELTSKIEHVVGVVECLEHIGWLKTSGPSEPAATILGAADGLRRKIGMALAPVDGTHHESALKDLRGRLDEPAFQKAWSEGEAMEWPEGASFALSELTTNAT
jgi:predicted ATPase/transcriptional regulator with XRE-family HTH domain